MTNGILSQRTGNRRLRITAQVLLYTILITQHFLGNAAIAAILIESVPAGASVFSVQRDSWEFHGYTPLRIKKEDLPGGRLVVSKTGYEDRRVTVGDKEKTIVKLVKDPGLDVVPETLRNICGPKDISAYADMVDAFRRISTKLRIDTPFEFVEIEDKTSLLFLARVVDRKTRAELRNARRSEGIKALEIQLADEVKPIIEKVIATARKITCADHLGVRLIYTDDKLKLDIKRIQVPWMQTYISQQGPYTVYTTKYGTRGENISTIKVSNGDGRFIDLYFELN